MTKTKKELNKNRYKKEYIILRSKDFYPMQISKRKLLFFAIIPLVISLIIANLKTINTTVSATPFNITTTITETVNIETTNKNHTEETTEAESYYNTTTETSAEDLNKADTETITTNSTTQVSTTKPTANNRFPIIHKDKSMTIKIDKLWHKTAYCYVADIQLSDYSRFYTACANNEYGSKQKTSDAAVLHNAVLAVNGDYSSPSVNNPLVRKGVVLNDWGVGCNAPGNYNAFTGQLGSPSDLGINTITYTQAAEEKQVTDTFCFGPAFIMEPAGNAVGGKCQRTFIGTDGTPGHFVVCVSEGRMSDGVSEGLTDQDCVDILLKYNCNFGVPLDGGGSSTMVFKGEVLNSVKQERAVCDFLIFK